MKPWLYFLRKSVSSLSQVDPTPFDLSWDHILLQFYAMKSLLTFNWCDRTIQESCDSHEVHIDFLCELINSKNKHFIFNSMFLKVWKVANIKIIIIHTPQLCFWGCIGVPPVGVPLHLFVPVRVPLIGVTWSFYKKKIINCLLTDSLTLQFCMFFLSQK